MPGPAPTGDRNPSLYNIYPSSPVTSTAANASNHAANLHRSNAVRGSLPRLQRSQTIDVSIPTLRRTISTIIYGENALDDPADIFSILTNRAEWAFRRSPSHDIDPQGWDSLGDEPESASASLNSHEQPPTPLPFRRQTVSVVERKHSVTLSSVGDSKDPLTAPLWQRRRRPRPAPLQSVHSNFDSVSSFPPPRVRSPADTADRSPSKRHGVVYQHPHDDEGEDADEPTAQNWNAPCTSPLQYEDPNRTCPIICPVPRRIRWPFFASPSDLDAMLNVPQPEIEGDMREYARFGDTVIRSSPGRLPQVVEPDEVPSFVSAELFPELSQDKGDGEDNA